MHQDEARHQLEHSDGVAAHRQPILALMEEEPEVVVSHLVGECFCCEELKEGALNELEQPH